MFCAECGHELDSNNICQNPNCIKNIKRENEDAQFESTIENPNNNVNNTQFTNQTNDNYNNQNPGNSNTEFRDANGISPIEMVEFIGDKNTEYYMDKWTRFQDNGKFISWNWPAFLFTLFWFWFRKMYDIVGILFAVNIASWLLLSNFGWMRSIVSLTITIGSGLLANQLYMNHATKKIKSAKFTASIGYDNNMLLRRLHSIGGVTWIPLIVGIILIVILVVIVVIGLIAFSTRLGYYGY